MNIYEAVTTVTGVLRDELEDKTIVNRKDVLLAREMIYRLIHFVDPKISAGDMNMYFSPPCGLTAARRIADNALAKENIELFMRVTARYQKVLANSKTD